MEGVSRAVSNRAAGWLVRLYLPYKNTLAKFFSDRPHGGKKLALAAAQRQLQQWQRQYPERGRLPFRSQPLKSNKLGVNGISETYHRSGRTGEKLPCFSVYYKLGGQRCTKCFYLHLYDSRQEALAEAVAFRKAMEKEMLKEWKQTKRAQARARK